MVLASGIVKVSAELKSISAKTQAQKSGLHAEYQVIKLLTQKNFKLIFHRLKTSISEIDLVFERNNKIILIEVKTLNNSWRAFERIDAKQRNKLMINLILFSEIFKEKKFEVYIAWVDNKNVISFCRPD